LRENGLRSYWTIRKPFVNRTNRMKRLAWARNHLSWDTKKWNTVIFSDESPFTFRFKSKQRIWRYFEERYNSKAMTGTVKHDKKINIWGCFSSNGVGPLHKVNGMMNSQQYIQNLKTNLIEKCQNLKGKTRSKWYFQQDNDSKHTSGVTRAFLDANRVSLLPWPAQSPDLNPIENLWSILDSKVKDRHPKDENDLFNILQTAWNELDPHILQNLIESMPNRCEEVIKLKGYPIKY
jgi:transposase